MDSHKRKILILVVLFGAWGLIFAFRSSLGTPPKPAVRGAAAPARKTAAQGGGLPRLKTELLHLPPGAYPPVAHNIFGTAPPTPGPLQAAVAPLSAAAGQPAPPDPFQEEAKRLRYTGFLQAGDKMMAFIVQGPEVHTVEVGTTLLGRFHLQAVTEDAVLLSSITGDRQVRLPLAAEAGGAPKK